MNDNLNETIFQNALVFNTFNELIFVLYKLKAWGKIAFMKTVSINILLRFNESVITVCLIFFLFLKLSKLGHT